jgi:hypothetical protein
MGGVSGSGIGLMSGLVGRKVDACVPGFRRGRTDHVEFRRHLDIWI